VKKARPARLFLYQDGPREGTKDFEGIAQCRELVKDEKIDWECEVRRLYQEKNYGCNPSGYMSQRWAFSQTDKCIVLEDDVIPSQSFFPFCMEVLDKYENDERVTMVAGFNTDERTKDIKESYFFTRAFSIWGWASWARVVNRWDGEYGFVKDKNQFELLQKKVNQYHQKKDMTKMVIDHAHSGKECFESIFWSYMLLHDGMAIMPSVNLINNVGYGSGAHYEGGKLSLIPKRLRKIFTMQRLELEFPLTHPKEVKEYPDYQKRFYLVNAWNNPWRKVQYSLEELWLNLLHGNFQNIVKSIKNRILKTFGLKKYT